MTAETAALLRGFPPILSGHPHTLVLGSMPSVASLQQQQYYGNAQNAFWKIMGIVLGFDAEAPYAQRRQALTGAGIAVWDVLAACERPGSLDASIIRETVVANDIAGLLHKHPTIRRVCLNGRSVERLFRQHMQHQQALPHDLALLTLPSTSPANARLRFADKLAAWQAVLCE